MIILSNFLVLGNELMVAAVQYITIEEHYATQRLDNYLFRILKGVPKSHIYRMIRHGEVRINKKRVKPDTRLCIGDCLRVPPVRMASPRVIEDGAPFQHALSACILHEDASLIVLNKPAGIAVHGGSGISLGVIEVFRRLRPELRFLELVHRLDRETSGCLLLAKKRSVLVALQTQLVEKTMQKTYWALLSRPWEGEAQRRVDAPLCKNVLRSGERVVRVGEGGKPSQTVFRCLESYHSACLAAVTPETGRTHQIRVHAAYMHHPIVGDQKYNLVQQEDGVDSISHALQCALTRKRLYLHAQAIRFMLNDKMYYFEAPLDAVFTQVLASLRQEQDA